MKLSQLRYFCKVYQLNNISKAAEALYVSQPAISMALRALEQELEVTLFLRNHNRLAPTQEGIRFYDLACDLLERADDIPRQMQKLSSNQIIITVGVPPVSSAFYIPKLSKIKRDYEKRHPNVTVELKEFPLFEGVPALLEEGKLSFAFSTLDENSFQHLEKVKLFQTPIMLCVSPDHPLAKEKSVHIRQFENEPLARTYHSASAVYRAINSYFEKYDVVPYYKYFFTQPKAVEALLLEKQAVMLERPEMQEMGSNLIFVPLEDPLMIDIGVLWSKKHPLSSEVANFIDRLCKVDFRM